MRRTSFASARIPRIASVNLRDHLSNKAAREVMTPHGFSTRHDEPTHPCSWFRHGRRLRVSRHQRTMPSAFMAAGSAKKNPPSAF
jgi:hypothetical protein